MAAKMITVVLACALAAPAMGAVTRKAAPRAVVVKPVRATVAPLPDTPETAALRAADAFALPVYAMMRARHLQLGASGDAPGVNHLLPRTALADATTRGAATPDNDTLSSSAWLDLAGGPVILDAPALPGRYHSAALIDVFGDTVAVVGTRTGGKGGRYLIAGPGWRGETPARTTLIRSPTNDAWLRVRVQIAGPADLPAATGLVRGFTLEVARDAPAPVPVAIVPTAVPDAATFLDVVAEALARNPLPPAATRGVEAAQLGVGRPYADLDPDQAKLWTVSLPALRAGIAGPGSEIDGWSASAGEVGALPPSEALSLTATVDRDGAPLSGVRAYTVRVPAGLPVSGFWSLSMYRRDGDGRLVFVDTSSRRFAINDRTPELRAERDGGFDIFVQPGRPSGERVVNWLPAPAGPFTLVFRAYLPRPEFTGGSFKLPPVEATEVIP